MLGNDSKRIAELILSVYQEMRNERSFNQMFGVIKTKAKAYSFVTDAVLSRKRKALNYSILQYLESHQSKEKPYHRETVQDHYLEVYYEALDTLTASIQQRFKLPHFEAYEDTESSILKSIHGQEVTNEKAHLKIPCDGEINMTHFVVEGGTLRTVFKKSKPRYFQDIFSQGKTLSNTQLSLILNTITIYKLILVNPATDETTIR